MIAVLGILVLSGAGLLFVCGQAFGWWLIALAFLLALFRYVAKRLPTP